MSFISYEKGSINFSENFDPNLKIQTFKMNAACSICLVSCTSMSDISSIPCGHVFHTDCIEKWLQKGSKHCSQCRKNLEKREITKLFFSTSQSENDLILELEEAKTEAEKRSFKFQKQNIDLRAEISIIQKENSDVHKENLEFREENLKLSMHLKSLQKNSEIKEMTSNKRIEELTAEINNLKSEGGNSKRQNDTKISINNALRLAASEGNSDTFKKLLDEISNKNPADTMGITPLHMAARNGHREIIKMILDVVEDKNPKTQWGQTPLHFATNSGHDKIVKLILDAVEDKNPESNIGYTPLHIGKSNFYSNIQH